MHHSGWRCASVDQWPSPTQQPTLVPAMKSDINDPLGKKFTLRRND